MSKRKIQIVGGPDYRSFVVKSDIVADTGFNITLRMSKDLPPSAIPMNGKGRRDFTLTLLCIGKYSAHGFMSDPCDFSFIAHLVTHTEAYIYVGHYNTNKRKGLCEEIPRGQFFLENPAMALMFPHLKFPNEIPSLAQAPDTIPSAEIK